MSTDRSATDPEGTSQERGSLTRFILRGGALAVAARMLILVAGFLVQVILARILPPEELGAYFLTQSIVTTIAVFSQMGLDRPLTRDLARFVGRGDLGEARGLLLLALRLAFVPVAGLSLLYATGGGRWLADTVFSSAIMAGASIAAAGWIAGSAFQTLGGAAMLGFRRVGASAFLGGALTNVMVVAALSFVVWMGWRIEFVTVVWIACLATWANVGLCALLLGKRVRSVPGRSAVSSRELWSAALPLVGAQLAGVAFTQADLWMVGSLLSEQDVALYGAAKRIARLVGVPLVTLAVVVPPIVADLHSRGELERLQRLLRGAATLAGIPSLMVVLPCLLFGDAILGLVFGPFFSDAGALLRIFCLERLASVFVGPSVVVLTMTGHERDVFKLVIVGGALSIAGIYVGGLLGGSLGIAVAFTGAGIIREGASLWLVVTRLGIRTDVDLLHWRAMRDAARRAIQS